jgi:hypothetical protein
VYIASCTATILWPGLKVFCNQQSHGFIRQVDIHVNCRVKRDKNNNPELLTNETRYQGGKLWSPGGGDES